MDDRGKVVSCCSLCSNMLDKDFRRDFLSPRVREAPIKTELSRLVRLRLLLFLPLPLLLLGRAVEIMTGEREVEEGGNGCCCATEVK